MMKRTGYSQSGERKAKKQQIFVFKYLRRLLMKESCYPVLLQSKEITPEIGQTRWAELSSV